MLIVDLEWSPSGIGQHEFFLSFTKYADYKRHFIKLQKVTVNKCVLENTSTPYA